MGNRGSTHRRPVQHLEVLRVGNVALQQLALYRAQRQLAPRAEYHQIDIAEINMKNERDDFTLFSVAAELCPLRIVLHSMPDIWTSVM